jgi:hypothetical protein
MLMSRQIQINVSKTNQLQIGFTGQFFHPINYMIRQKWLNYHYSDLRVSDIQLHQMAKRATPEILR